MSNQLEKIKELIERRATARMGGGCLLYTSDAADE